MITFCSIQHLPNLPQLLMQKFIHSLKRCEIILGAKQYYNKLKSYNKKGSDVFTNKTWIEYCDFFVTSKIEK